MRTTIDALNTLSADWLALVVSALWQSLLVALVVALVAILWRRGSPAARYWLWQIVSIKLLLVPLWSWSLPLPWLPAEPPAVAPSIVAPSTVASSARPDAILAPADAVPAPAPEAPSIDLPPANLQATDSPAATRPLAARPAAEPSTAGLAELSGSSWLLAGWSALVALQLARLAWQHRRLATLLSAAEPAGDSLVAATADVAASLGLARPPVVLLTAADCSPFVCRALRPTLVLPATIVDELGPDELRQVLAHELAHVKRHDLVWGWLPELARIVYFFHPVAHWAAYRVQLERELACDQMAMAASGRSAAEYADTLVRVVSSTSRPELLRIAVGAGLDGKRPPAARRAPATNDTASDFNPRSAID